jgi:hypothetical protein
LRGFDASGDFVVQAQRIPVERAVDCHGVVGKTVQFVDVERLAIIGHLHHPPRLSTEINGYNIFCGHRKPYKNKMT